MDVSPLRRLSGSLLFALCLLLLGEGLARLLTGPPLVPVVVRMPDGTEGLFEGEPLRPRLPEQAAWWPAGPPDPARPRVVFLGGSSLAGPPTDHGLAVHRFGELLDVEVVNLAVGGMDSGHLLANLPGVLALAPALVVIYEGHNDLGNASFSRRFADPRAVAMARARSLLGQSRVFELLEAAWRGRDERPVVVQWDSQQTRLGPAERAQIVDEFERRTAALLDGLRQAGIPVLLSTVVSNAFFPSADGQCPERVRALGLEPTRMAVVSLKELDPAALEAALADQECAELRLFEARLRWATEPRLAAAQLRALRDQDAMPLRAPSEINERIRGLVGEGVHLVDAAAVFQELGGGVEPPGWFRDPVHFNGQGHAALAALLARSAAPLLGRPVPVAPLPPLRPLDARACLSARCPGSRPSPR